ncbi:MAG: hypothetical protein HYV09_07860 [Deltaproteobacteria bacterium]|nr:hypothetical protein [Deltaproteobacteria bacterium]
MPRRCSVCDHAARDEIDRALISGEPFRNIAERFAGLTAASIHRHRHGHLTAAVRHAREAEDVQRGATLLDQVRALHARTLRLLAKAEAEDDAPTALRALREARAGLELLAKLLGELDTAPTVTVSLGTEWASLRTAILRALEPFPDARSAVAQAIARSADAS